MLSRQELRCQALTTGRLPCHLEAPAFPCFLFLCWGLDSAPTVALQVANTRLCVPEGSRTTAYPSGPARRQVHPWFLAKHSETQRRMVANWSIICSQHIQMIPCLTAHLPQPILQSALFSQSELFMRLNDQMGTRLNREWNLQILFRYVNTQV